MSAPFTLPELPWAQDALAPHMSKETIEFHYGKHHQGYVNKLNAAVQGTDFATMSLDDVVLKASGKMFNSAAQHWNHSFFWKCLAPNAGGEPTGKLLEAIVQSFGSFEAFKEKFGAIAGGHFGSGWAWLVRDSADGSLKVVDTHDADTPLRHGLQPLLTCDVWEHAYYIDYRNNRGAYVDAFWKLVNWEFVAENFSKQSQ